MAANERIRIVKAVRVKGGKVHFAFEEGMTLVCASNSNKPAHKVLANQEVTCTRCINLSVSFHPPAFEIVK